jgi:hypothetical protein
MHLKVSLNKHQSFSQKELLKLQACLPLLEKVVNGQKFKERICEIKKFTSCDLNGQQVYEIFMNGRQVGDTTDDREMDIDLTIYSTWPWITTVGYTYANVVRTWINRKFFLAFTLAGIAGNISHEYCHKLGFDHTSHWTPERDASVPYFIGYLIEELVQEMI